MCVHPYFIENKFGDYIPVPCGKCFQCLKQWSNDWRFRLNQERNHCSASVFLTLTYRDKCLPVAYNNDACEWQSYLVKSDLQKFFKRLRYNCPDLKFRYFAVGEYGGDYNRAHFHVVLFFTNTAGLSFNKLYNLLFYTWGKGFIKLKSTSNKHINYVSGYFNKLDKSPHLVAPFKCMSKSIGLCYLNQVMIDYFFRTFATSVPNPCGKGFQRLPRYYRKKLDDMTYDVVFDSQGYKWSDIASIQPRKAPKENTTAYYIKWFTDNYLEAYQEVYSKLIARNRKYGYQIPEKLDNPNVLFSFWIQNIPLILDSISTDKRLLDKALVQHKYTRLKENEILYSSS